MQFKRVVDGVAWCAVLMLCASVAGAAGGAPQKAPTESLSLYGERNVDLKSYLSGQIVDSPAITWEAVLQQLALGLTSDPSRGIVADRLAPRTIVPANKEDRCALEAPVQLNNIEIAFADAFMLALLDTDQCVVLAVVDKSATPRILSAAELGTMGGPMMGGIHYAIDDLFAVGSGAWATWIKSDHENSDEGFIDYQLYMISSGRLSLVYEGPSLYNLKSGRDAAFFSATMTVLPTSHAGYRDIRIAVDEKARIDARRARRHYEWTIAWDAARKKYMGGSTELMNRVKQLNKN